RPRPKRPRPRARASRRSRRRRRPDHGADPAAPPAAAAMRSLPPLAPPVGTAPLVPRSGGRVAAGPRPPRGRARRLALPRGVVLATESTGPVLPRPGPPGAGATGGAVRSVAERERQDGGIDV